MRFYTRTPRSERGNSSTPRGSLGPAQPQSPSKRTTSPAPLVRLVSSGTSHKRNCAICGRVWPRSRDISLQRRCFPLSRTMSRDSRTHRVCLTILSLADIWGISSLGLLHIKLLRTLLYRFFYGHGMRSVRYGRRSGTAKPQGPRVFARACFVTYRRAIFQTSTNFHFQLLRFPASPWVFRPLERAPR